MIVSTNFVLFAIEWPHYIHSSHLGSSKLLQAWVVGVVHEVVDGIHTGEVRTWVTSYGTFKQCRIWLLGRVRYKVTSVAIRTGVAFKSMVQAKPVSYFMSQRDSKVTASRPPSWDCIDINEHPVCRIKSSCIFSLVEKTRKPRVRASRNLAAPIRHQALGSALFIKCTHCIVCRWW